MIMMSGFVVAVVSEYFAIPGYQNICQIFHWLLCHPNRCQMISPSPFDNSVHKAAITGLNEGIG